MVGQVIELQPGSCGGGEQNSSAQWSGSLAFEATGKAFCWGLVLGKVVLLRCDLVLALPQRLHAVLGSLFLLC